MFFLDTSMVYLFILVVLVTLLFNSLFTVKQQSVIIIERFGRFNKMVTSGLSWKIPIIDQIVGRMNLRLQQLDVNIETKTKDNVFVQILVSVQFQVITSKIYEAYYKLDRPAMQIQAFVFDVVRAKVPSIDLDDVFAKKDDIAVNVQHELGDIMGDFGYEIIKTLSYRYTA